MLTHPPPFPFLTLLSLFLATTSAHSSPTPTGIHVESSTHPAPPPVPLGAISIPFYQRHPAHLVRRASPDTIRSWALREKGRIRGKYGPIDDEDDAALDKRQMITTALSTAQRNTETFPATSSDAVSGAASRTQSADSSMMTMPVGAVAVQNFEADLAYFAPVGVGVPAQSMNVILDTGSADLWIASSDCTPDTGCSNITLYNTTESRTSVDLDTSFSVRYGSGSASGDLHRDYVSFGGYNVSGQTFALTDVVSTDLITGNLSGLLGLGWQGLAASGAMPFWQNLYQAGVLPFPGFAFALTRFVNITHADSVEPGGLLTLGYLNTTLYDGNITFVDIPNGMQSYWVIPMSAVGVNGTNVTETETYAAIDTGTTLIGGPRDIVSDLYSRIEGAQAATGAYVGYYSYPCSTDVNVTLTFGGVSWNVSSDDFNLGPFGVTNNVSTCLGALFDLSLSSTSRISWVVGAAFLKNVYSVFRAEPPSVGFAHLITGNHTADFYNITYFPNGTVDQSGDGTGRNNTYAIIPNGIYGPSGTASVKATPTPQQVTTAIEAGQTVSRTEIPATPASEARQLVAPVALGSLLALGSWVLL